MWPAHARRTLASLRLSASQAMTVSVGTRGIIRAHAQPRERSSLSGKPKPGPEPDPLGGWGTDLAVALADAADAPPRAVLSRSGSEDTQVCPSHLAPVGPT